MKDVAERKKYAHAADPPVVFSPSLFTSVLPVPPICLHSVPPCPVLLLPYCRHPVSSTPPPLHFLPPFPVRTHSHCHKHRSPTHTLREAESLDFIIYPRNSVTSWHQPLVSLFSSGFYFSVEVTTSHVHSERKTSWVCWRKWHQTLI